jgi:hypothetical protein
VKRINWGRVILGGIAAGVVLGIGEYVLHEYVLGARMQEAMIEMEMENPTGADIAIFSAITLVTGILLVWLYAAIRPRFGPGPRTAIVAGLFLWVPLNVFWYGYNLAWETFPQDVITTSTVWGFFALPIATLVGAWLYRE